MKKINVLLLTIMLAVGAQSMVQAQSKVAHINTTDLVSVMPEMKAAEEENRKRIEEVQGMQQNIGGYRQQAMQDLQQKEVDLFQPILEKARTAIQKVARAQGFQYVLDASQGTGVILSDGKDLLADVKKELGI
jgi:outer membrane protein